MATPIEDTVMAMSLRGADVINQVSTTNGVLVEYVFYHNAAWYVRDTNSLDVNLSLDKSGFSGSRRDGSSVSFPENPDSCEPDYLALSACFFALEMDPFPEGRASCDIISRQGQLVSYFSTPLRVAGYGSDATSQPHVTDERELVAQQESVLKSTRNLLHNTKQKLADPKADATFYAKKVANYQHTYDNAAAALDAASNPTAQGYLFNSRTVPFSFGKDGYPAFDEFQALQDLGSQAVEANGFIQKKKRPIMGSAMIIGGEAYISGSEPSNVGGIVNPVVTKLLGEIDSGDRSRGHGKCAEMVILNRYLSAHGISDLDAAKAHFAKVGAASYARIVSSSTPAAPCSSCWKVLRGLGISFESGHKIKAVTAKSRHLIVQRNKANIGKLKQMEAETCFIVNHDVFFGEEYRNHVQELAKGAADSVDLLAELVFVITNGQIKFWWTSGARGILMHVVGEALAEAAPNLRWDKTIGGVQANLRGAKRS
ncbi:hypothetical protein OTB20_41640 [Streptomyces sp. H27-H1]|uniref:hypothetical protein n=1 Tax=Streptomyces sp. H27-H1 TaxID=2996461 RepID=UPI00226E2417|nr:hypothetical protein [Streptomyces sp. H27-H1]MCY0932521.1 hypothetical protein [Streptomyces sp. H27-H1]